MRIVLKCRRPIDHTRPTRGEKNIRVPCGIFLAEKFFSQHHYLSSARTL